MKKTDHELVYLDTLEQTNGHSEMREPRRIREHVSQRITHEERSKYDTQVQSHWLGIHKDVPEVSQFLGTSNQCTVPIPNVRRQRHRISARDATSQTVKCPPSKLRVCLSLYFLVYNASVAHLLAKQLLVVPVPFQLS